MTRDNNSPSIQNERWTHSDLIARVVIAQEVSSVIYKNHAWATFGIVNTSIASYMIS